MATQWTAGTTSGQVLTAATLNTIGAVWETWTPVLTASTTNPTLGTGSTQFGRYAQVNKIVSGFGQINFGTSGANGGFQFYFVSLPIAMQGNSTVIGQWRVFDASAGASYLGTLIFNTSTSALLFFNNPASVITNTAPFTWTNNDFIQYNFQYEAA